MYKIAGEGDSDDSDDEDDDDDDEEDGYFGGGHSSFATAGRGEIE